MGLLKKIGKLFPGTGRHAARRAANEARNYVTEAQTKTAAFEQKAVKEKRRSQKLALRGIRSKRAASRFSATDNQYTSYGSPTIG